MFVRCSVMALMVLAVSVSRADEPDAGPPNADGEPLDVADLVWSGHPMAMIAGERAHAVLDVILPASVQTLHYEIGVAPGRRDGFEVPEVKPTRGLWRRGEGPSGDRVSISVPIEARTAAVGMHTVELVAFLRGCVARRCVEVRDVPVSVWIQVSPAAPVGERGR